MSQPGGKWCNPFYSTSQIIVQMHKKICENLYVLGAKLILLQMLKCRLESSSILQETIRQSKYLPTYFKNFTNLTLISPEELAPSPQPFNPSRYTCMV